MLSKESFFKIENLRTEIDKTVDAINLSNSALSNVGLGLRTESIDLFQRKIANVTSAAKDLNEQTKNIQYFAGGTWFSDFTWMMNKLPIVEYLQQLRDEIPVLTDKLLYGNLNDEQRKATRMR